jgi:hypothetical protein
MMSLYSTFVLLVLIAAIDGRGGTKQEHLKKISKELKWKQEIMNEIEVRRSCCVA